ncbi:hypothetical protein GHT09_005093 [Marmota monax]|uniref:Uncharacterized protein n=1 Tax=Marmota monax TaxID=9995 RepID=A0A834ULW7_MARMO|nr:hypothetical protein GHT09_005093 [Marmota monax]
MNCPLEDVDGMQVWSSAGLGTGSHYLASVLYLRIIELAPASAWWEPAMSRQLQLPVLQLLRSQITLGNWVLSSKTKTTWAFFPSNMPSPSIGKLQVQEERLDSCLRPQPQQTCLSRPSPHSCAQHCHLPSLSGSLSTLCPSLASCPAVF